MSDEDNSQKLLEVLVKAGTISDAQAQIALLDHQSTDLSIDDVLVLRGWVTREVVLKHAPWLSEPQAPAAKGKAEEQETEYRKNFKKYEALMAEIMGDKAS